MIAHHSSYGCNLQPGDVLGSGTVSGAAPDTLGSMIELTEGGRSPLTLQGGEKRAFLEEGDEVIESARCTATGYRRIGFGVASGRVI
jgi:fumarylacetoacetase